MEYAVYTYGGGEILWKVFNGIAILFQSESHYFTSIGKLTIGVSLLLVALRSIPQASLPIFFKSWFLPTTLLIALFFGPKAQVHIIDEIDTSFRHAKVDHIPLGIAIVASFTSNLSKHLTEVTETKFSSSDSERFSKVGPMFATKMIHHAQQLTIKDPLMRENMKDFVRQCYAWPYVFSNLNPGKRAALETEDILEFIKAHPHPLLGIYWRHPNGRSEFQNCNQCVVKVSEALQVEVGYGIQSLAGKLFSPANDPGAPSRRLNQYFGDAWSSIAKNSSSMAQVVQQELLINSYREALQDKRDELGLGRTDTSLLQLNAARGQVTQNNTFLAKAAMAGGHVVTLHGLFFALSLIFFALVAPLTFLPQGLRLLTTWLKVMFWLATWPVMMTVLNMLGHMYAANALASELVGLNSGLSLLTQGGLSETSYNAYCWVMGLQLSVPFISWSLISGGGYALSQMASSLTQTAEGFAAKAGSEMVDGNVSFDTQSIGNRSMANMQIAQQQLSPSFNTGMRFDDGKLSLLHGPHGSVVAQEHVSSLGTNLTRNDTAGMMYSLESQRSQSAAFQEGVQAQYAVTTGSNEMYAFATNAATSTAINDSFGSSHAANVQKQAQDLLSQAQKIGIQHGKDAKVAFDAAIKGSMGIGTGKGSLFSIGVEGTGGFNTASADTNLVQKIKDSDLGKQFSESLQKLISYSNEHRAALSDTIGTSHLDQAQESFAKAKSHTSSMGWHMNQSDGFQRRAQESRNTSTTSTTNATDELIAKSAQTYGGNRVFGVESLVRQGGAEQMAASQVGSSSNLGSTPPIRNEADLNTIYTEGVKSMGPIPTHNQELENKRSKANLGGQENRINTQVDEMREAGAHQMNHTAIQIAQQAENLDHERQVKEKHYQHVIDKTLVSSAADKSGENLSEYARKTGKKISKFFRR